MRIGRLIVGDFITRYGWQLKIGVWIRPFFWITVLAKATFGYAYFGISGFIYGHVHYGIERHGRRWVIKRR